MSTYRVELELSGTKYYQEIEADYFEPESALVFFKSNGRKVAAFNYWISVEELNE